jgi:hypothetical protein
MAALIRLPLLPIDVISARFISHSMAIPLASRRCISRPRSAAEFILAARTILFIVSMFYAGRLSRRSAAAQSAHIASRHEAAFTLYSLYACRPCARAGRG